MKHPSLVAFLNSMLESSADVVLINTEEESQLNQANCLFHSHSQLQKKLNEISPKFFRPIYWQNVKETVIDSMPSSSNTYKGLEKYFDLQYREQITHAENGIKFHIAPSYSYGVEFYQPEIAHDLSDLNKGKVANHNSVISRDRSRHECGEDPKLVFLGTCGALPTKRRNVSSLLVELRYTIDCHICTFVFLILFKVLLNRIQVTF